jgi:outer membrane lipoprotein-sorting protein
LEDHDFEDEGPSEDDIIISDSGSLGSKTSVSAGGKNIGEFRSTEEAEKAIVDWINKNKWYPTIWYQDDHGGVDIYTLEPKNQKKIKI